MTADGYLLDGVDHQLSDRDSLADGVDHWYRAQPVHLLDEVDHLIDGVDHHVG